MELPGQRSWASVLESFINHRDRKCAFDDQGRMVRRHVLVRADHIDGLGKEANRIEAGRVLGLRAAGGRAKRYVDWNRRVQRILALPPSWAEDHGIPDRSFRYLKQVLRSGRIPQGHGARTFETVQTALMSDRGQPALSQLP